MAARGGAGERGRVERDGGAARTRACARRHGRAAGSRAAAGRGRRAAAQPARPARCLRLVHSRAMVTTSYVKYFMSNNIAQVNNYRSSRYDKNWDRT